MTKRMRDASSPLSEFVPAFLAARRSLAAHTLRDYGRYLRSFDEFTGHKSLGDALTLDNAYRWQEQMKERGKFTPVNASNALKSFATWLASSRNLIGPGGGTVLVGFAAPKVTATPRKPITPAQLTHVWTSIEQRPRRDRARARAYLRLLYATGLRKGDIPPLLKSNLHVDAARTSGTLIATAAVPGGKPERRRIRLDRITVAALDDYFAERPPYRGKPPEPLFLSEKGDGFTVYGFSTWADRIFDYIYEKTGWRGSSDSFRETWQQESQADIADGELRRRCADLLLAESDHDRAIREACLVLEDRVRTRSGADQSQIGTSLMEWALAPNSPRLPLAKHPNEQRGAMEIYRGVIAFYRNGTGHRIRDDFDPKEALRVVRWIDHLLGLLDSVPPTIS